MTLATPITLVYAGLLGIFLIVLGGYVVRTRIRERISIGDNGNPAMLAAIRVHANAAENIPVAVLLLMLLELNGGSALALHAYGVALLAGRLLHAFGLSRKKSVNRWRQLGMVLTWLTIIGLSASLLLRAFAG